MSPQDRDNDKIADICAAIEKINRYTFGMDLQAFQASELVQDAVLKNIGVIGEAVTKLSDGLKKAHPRIQWRDIAGMRNRVVHDYNRVSLMLVWNTIQDVLPEFLQAVRLMQAEIDSQATKPSASPKPP
ncbi:MAG: DUF86 domain-containing protein [Rhodocyclaceae bacterium]|nr:MAG: DUF86 domain-containing protein [Rhodocyclaceae bacterium]